MLWQKMVFALSVARNHQDNIKEIINEHYKYMKQHITKSQWESADKHYIENKTGWLDYREITIGQMIEYLGDDLFKIEALNQNYLVWLNDRKEINMNAELCDALWEACKYKLKQ